MKSEILLLSILLSFSLLQADQYKIVPQGWSLNGVGLNEKSIKTSTLSSDIKTIWKYEGNGWVAYSPNSETQDLITNSGIETLNSLEPGDGFWVQFKYRNQYKPLNNNLYKKNLRIMETLQLKLATQNWGDTFQGTFTGIADSLNSLFKLPYNINLTIKECNTVNAYYDPTNNEITMCIELFNYGYLVYSLEYEHEKAVQYTAEMFSFVLFHELGHAFIDAYNLPVLGNEEILCR